MLICKDCFADEELRSEVSFNGSDFGLCEVCHSTDILIDSSEFYAFFDGLVKLFSPSESGKPIAELIQEDWHLFKDSKVATILLNEVLINGKYPFSINNRVNYRSDIINRIAVWDRLKKSVKENSRFFTSIDEFLQYKYISPGGDGLRVGQKLFRSRITPVGQKKIKGKNMGCPPKDLATPGRANPIGIPYLYLCDTAKTTYFEVRAVYLDKLSVGTFEIVRDLSLVDFIYDVNLYLSFVDGSLPLSEIIIKKKIIDAISSDLSKPLRRYDSELEYVPTQFICEYCKDYVNADGISFESSLHRGGRNYVLFDQTAAKCTRVVSHIISRIDIDIK